MKTLHVVAAIIEKSDKILIAQRLKGEFASLWEVEPGVGTVSGPVYISGGRAKKLIKMLTGHQYKMHNTD